MGRNAALKTADGVEWRFGVMSGSRWRIGDDAFLTQNRTVHVTSLGTHIKKRRAPGARRW